MKKKIKYTPQHLEFLRTKYLSMSVRTLTPAFNKEFGLKKTEVAIKSTLGNHKITCGRKGKEKLMPKYLKYTEEQARWIRRNYKEKNIQELTTEFNRRFETHKTAGRIKAFTTNHKITSGRTGRFEKGSVPWNKGTKDLTGPNKGSFKKGNIPANSKPLGTERVDAKDGYILIKVAERNPNTGSQTRYKHKHVHIWEQAHGPVPNGMVVAFKDSDKSNFALENLMLISRAELLCFNQLGYTDMPGELKPYVRTLAGLKVQTWEKEKDAHR